jgi:hypothetical protein
MGVQAIFKVCGLKIGQSGGIGLLNRPLADFCRPRE